MSRKVASFLVISGVILLSLLGVSCSILSLSIPPESVTIYVSSSLGNDNNDGTSPSTPVKSLTRAMEIARENGGYSEIRVASGTYTPGSGLASSGAGVIIDVPNVSIIGGWDATFSTKEGNSELDGLGVLNTIIMIKGVENVSLENLVIKGGRWDEGAGGGIFASNVVSLSVAFTVKVRNNYAKYGGGIYLGYGSSNNNINCEIYQNEAVNGGGIFIDGSLNNNVVCRIYENRASWGGGVYIYGSVSNKVSAIVYSNDAMYGGGVAINLGGYNEISGHIYANFGTNSGGSGGGIRVYSSYQNTISANVYSNKAANGGGLYIMNSTNTIINGSVYANSTPGNGGGVYLNNSNPTSIVGWVTNNSASGTGGGVYTNVPHTTSTFAGSRIVNNIPNNFN